MLDCFFPPSKRFADFILSAQKLAPNDAFVLKEGQIDKKISHEGESDQNRRIWRVFRDAVDGAFSLSKQRKIASRYGFNWDQLIESDFACEVRYLEYFGVGAATVTESDLQQAQWEKLWLPFSLSSRNPEEIHDLFKHATQYSYLGECEDPTEISGGARKFHQNFLYDTFRVDQARNALFRGVENLVSKDPQIPRLHPYYQRLAMGITSLLDTKEGGGDEGLIIPAPGACDKQLDYYKVHKVISKDGLNAFAYTPISHSSSLRPVLSFRCTKQNFGYDNAFLSNLNNFDEHIGKMGYKACQKELEELIQDEAFTQGKKIDVICFSQGGGYANYFMHDHWRAVRDFVGFNCVGGGKEILGELAAQINALDEKAIPPNFYLHRNIGDWVNKTGDHHISFGVNHSNCRQTIYEWKIDDLPLPSNNPFDFSAAKQWLDLHGKRTMDTDSERTPRSQYNFKWKYDYTLHLGRTQCNPVLDTYKRDGQLENLRRQIGYNIVFKLVMFIYRSIDFSCRLFNYEVPDFLRKFLRL